MTKSQTPLAIEIAPTTDSPVNPLAHFTFNVESKMIGSKEVLAIRSSEIHVALEIKTRHNDWIERRVSEYKFIENQDFLRYSNLSSTKSLSSKARPQQVKEVWVTIEMAKMLAMVERTPISHEVRKYFIDIENRYYESKNLSLTIDDPKLPLKYSLKFIADEIDGADRIVKYYGLTGNQAKLSVVQMIRRLYGIDILNLSGQTKGLISESQQHDFSPTEIGGMLKPIQSARKVNQLLIEAGYQTRSENPKLNRVVYQVTDLGKSFAILKDTTKKHSNGTPILQVRWFEKIVEFLQSRVVF